MSRSTPAAEFFVVKRFQGKESRYPLTEALVELGLLVKTATGDAVTQRVIDMKRSSINVAIKPIDLRTPRQTIAIKSICDAGRLDAEDECKDFFKEDINPDELHMQAAASFIDHLKKRKDEEDEKRHQQGIPNESQDAVNRAKAMAAMGLVWKEGSEFNVQSPGFNKKVFRVWKDEEGRAQCADGVMPCDAVKEGRKDNPRFRCTHILAVAFHLKEHPEDGEPKKADAGS